MTPKISLITAIVGAALVFAVPAWSAYGLGDGVDRTQPTSQAVSPDWFERAAAVAVLKHEAMLNARERGLGVADSKPASSMLDARERAQVEKTLFEKNVVTPVDPRSDGLNRLYGLGEYSTMLDARERAQVEKTLFEKNVVTPVDPRSDGLNRLYGLGEFAPPVVADDRFTIDHSNVPVTVEAPTSGRDIEWPTVGIGFAIGLMLILGLVLSLKATHTRPFAH